MPGWADGRLRHLGVALAPKERRDVELILVEREARIAAGVGAVVGHNFTFWLHFKGGKGIATSAGVLLALLPWSLVAAWSLWLILLYTTRYVAVASIGAAIMVPASALALHWWRGDPGLPRVGFAVLIGALAIWRHRSNIRRLLDGTENRFVRKSKTAPAAP